MSITTYLVCIDCKESIWIGQGDYIYTSMPKEMSDMNKFLQKHRSYPVNHLLVFTDEHQLDYFDYDNAETGLWGY